MFVINNIKYFYLKKLGGQIDPLLKSSGGGGTCSPIFLLGSGLCLQPYLGCEAYNNRYRFTHLSSSDYISLYRASGFEPSPLGVAIPIRA